MLTHEKNTILNKVSELENWIKGYFTPHEKDINGHKDISLLNNINRNLNSIKALINKS